MADNIEKLRELERKRQADIARREAEIEAKKQAEEEEEAQKKARIAEAFGLSEEEKASYYGKGRDEKQTAVEPTPYIPKQETSSFSGSPTPASTESALIKQVAKKGPPSPAATVIGRTAVKKAQSAPTSPLSQEEENIYYKQYKDALASLPQETPEDREEYRQQKKELRDLYKQQADRAEWISLADRIGNALVRYGAARAGEKSGVDMTQINYGPGYDLSSALSRAKQEYEQGYEDISEEQKAKDAARKAKREAAAQEVEGKYRLSKFGADLEAQKASEKEKAADRASREKIAAMSISRQLQKNASKGELSEYQKAILDLRNREATAKEAKELAKLAEQDAVDRANVETYLGMSDKEKAKFAPTAAASMGRLGITDIEKLQEDYDKAQEGVFFSGDEAAKARVQQKLTAKNIREALDSISKRNQASPPPSTSSTIKVKGPSGTVAEMTREAAAKYLGKPGYTEIE